MIGYELSYGVIIYNIIGNYIQHIIIHHLTWLGNIKPCQIQEKLQIQELIEIVGGHVMLRSHAAFIVLYSHMNVEQSCSSPPYLTIYLVYYSSLWHLENRPHGKPQQRELQRQANRKRKIRKKMVQSSHYVY